MVRPDEVVVCQGDASSAMFVVYRGELSTAYLVTDEEGVVRTGEAASDILGIEVGHAPAAQAAQPRRRSSGATIRRRARSVGGGPVPAAG